MKAGLANLPSRGHLTNVQSGSLFTSSPSLYIACHNTAPPPGQHIKTDPTSIIIRAIQARKGQDLAKKKQNPKPDKGKRKLEEEEPERSAPLAKVSASAAASDGVGPSSAGPATSSRLAIAPRKSGGSRSQTEEGASPPSSPRSSQFTRVGLAARTIRDMQVILKAWSLPVSGKKDDLINRILETQRSARSSS